MLLKLKKFFTNLVNLRSLTAVREGLTGIMPVIITGAAALTIEYFPIEVYQNFIAGLFGGKFIEFLEIIYNATFGLMSVYLAVSISVSYIRHSPHRYGLSAIPFSSLICFLIVGYSSDLKGFGVQGVFLAMVSAVLSTKLLIYLSSMKSEKHHRYIDGSDINFDKALKMIIPTMITVSLFAAVNIAVGHIFKVENMFELFVKAINKLFLPMGRSFASAFLFTILSSFLWFFGIHGNNVFEPVVAELFKPAINVNIDLAAAGYMPTEIFTKQFFDVFILMGGSGTLICLLIAILLFSKRKSARRLSKIAALPMLFNINELMVFGLPIILNPTMLIPFILVPIVSFLTTYIAMRTGLVPLTISDVNWTVPVIISGYIATGSVSGSILQVINMALGTLIYRPFVKQYDKISVKNTKHNYNELVKVLEESEELAAPVTLTDMNNDVGALARALSDDLRYALTQREIMVYYQPQYNNDKRYASSEALLRWRHPFYGMIYPPLAIKLASENGFLEELEEYVLLKSVVDSAEIAKHFPTLGEIGVNVSATTIQKDEYFEFLKKIAQRPDFRPNDICLEITEQSVLICTTATMERLNAIRDLGFRLAIDDFSTGHTSFKYLQDNRFDVIKLDGTLIKHILTNTRNVDIIKSIIMLAESLECDVIAEYVETEEQRQLLEDIGCTLYQGYLFSPAVTLEDLIKRLYKEERH